ncbi:hypothetical protein A9G47_12410 [Gilliamella sp. WF3-4]|nr:hypothetical protein A9G47_12410 [Gilliamella apicola]
MLYFYLLHQAYAYYLPELLITSAKAMDIAEDEAIVRAEANALAIGKQKARFKGFIINKTVFWIRDFEKILSNSYLFKRWATLTIEEYLAVKAWLIWITREDTYQDAEDIYQNDESVCQNNVMNSLISLDKLIDLAKQREKWRCK